MIIMESVEISAGLQVPPSASVVASYHTGSVLAESHCVVQELVRVHQGCPATLTTFWRPLESDFWS